MNKSRLIGRLPQWLCVLRSCSSDPVKAYADHNSGCVHATLGKYSHESEKIAVSWNLSHVTGSSNRVESLMRLFFQKVVA